MTDVATGSDLLWIARGHWEIFITTYLFLGGLSGGAYLTSVASSELFRPRAEGPAELFACEETSRWGAVVGVLAIAVGAMALLYHLGAPLRALAFPILFENFGSWLVIGTWVIVLFSLFVTLEAFWLLFGTAHDDPDGLSFFPRWILVWIDDYLPTSWSVLAALDRLADLLRPTGTRRTLVRGVGGLLAAGVIVYTAMLLTDVSVVPLWNRQYLPIVFLMSGASTGISAALLGTVASGGGLSRTNHLFCLADDGLIAVETVTVLGLLSVLASGGPAAERSRELLLSGAYSPHFLVGVLALGLVVPFALSMTMTSLVKFTDFEETSVGASAFTGGFAVKYVLVLAGGFLLRYVVIFGAVKQPLGVP